MSNYSQEELDSLLGSVGERVNIHRSVVFFNPKQIFIDSDVRVDCFSMLSAGQNGIHIGHHCHLSAGVYLYGGGDKIEIEPFVGISARTTLFTSCDDFVEGYMTGPLIPAHFKKVLNGSITLRKHSLVGSGSIILPNVELGIGAIVGAMSLVKHTVKPYAIVVGIPAKETGIRCSKRLLELEKEFLAKKSMP